MQQQTQQQERFDVKKIPRFSLPPKLRLSFPFRKSLSERQPANAHGK